MSFPAGGAEVSPGMIHRLPGALRALFWSCAVLAQGATPARAADSLDIIGKWEVIAIEEPDPANPHLTTIQHPQRGTMAMIIDHATITSSVIVPGQPAQVDKQRYAVEEDAADHVLIRVAAHKPYNISISSDPNGHDLRWSSHDFDITLTRFDPAAIRAATQAEQAAATRSAIAPAGPILDQSLQGTIDGHPWSAVACVRSAVQPRSDAVRISILCEEPDAEGRSPLAQLLVDVPRTVGHLVLGPTTSITFCIPPGRNLVANDGELAVTAASAQTLTVALSARFDVDNQVNGHFIVDLSQSRVQAQGPASTPSHAPPPTSQTAAPAP